MSRHTESGAFCHSSLFPFPPDAISSVLLFICSHLINPEGKWQFLTAIPGFAISLGERTARTPNLSAVTPPKSNRKVHLSKKVSNQNCKFILLSKAACADYVILQKLKPKPDNGLLVNATSKFPKAFRSQPNISWPCNQLNIICYFWTL